MNDDVKTRDFAVAVALRVHDAAKDMNREQGYEVFEHDAIPSAFIAALEAQNPPFTVAPLRAEPSRSSPDPDWIDHLPGVTAAFGVTFGELMVPVSAIREHFAAASRLGSSPDLTGLDPD